MEGCLHKSCTQGLLSFWGILGGGKGGALSAVRVQCNYLGAGP